MAPFQEGGSPDLMTPDIVLAFMAGFAIGLVMAGIVIPAMIDIWAGKRRNPPYLPRQRRHRDR